MPTDTGHYFTLAALRASSQHLASTEEFPEDRLDTARAFAELALEEACRVAFLPREHTETLRAPGLVGRLDRHEIRSITTVTAGGDPVSVDDVTLKGRRIYLPVTIAGRDVLVTYEHGLDEPPARIADAAMTLARVRLLKGPVTDRATQLPAPGGGTINLATPGVFGSEFGVPDVDQVVRTYRRPKINPFGL